MTEIQESFDPGAIQRLNTLIETTDAEIVLSSTWRKFKKIDEMNAIFKELGVVKPIMEYTKGTTLGFRGLEIEDWLAAHGFNYTLDSLERCREFLKTSIIKNYVILDDDSDMTYTQRFNFVNVDYLVGLTDSDVKIASNILKWDFADYFFDCRGYFVGR
jgi:hypothetical protein